MVLAAGLRAGSGSSSADPVQVRRGQLSPGAARGKVWSLEMEEWGQTREVCVKLGSDPPQTPGAIAWPLLLEAEFRGRSELPG